MKENIQEIIERYELKSGAHTSLKKGACIMRFLSKVRVEKGCWVWTGRLMHKGYGQFSPTSKKNVRAHKFSYETFISKVPHGLCLDHLCRNRSCVNPEHLEPVTNRENLRRSNIAPAEINSRKTHCPKGHAYLGDNLRVRPNGSRDCRACELEESRRYNDKNRDIKNARRRARRANGKEN